jgi:KDO2-lipid IV(A) lauroyltransferase
MTARRFGIRVLLWLANLHRRMLPVYFALIGARRAYLVIDALARWQYWLLTPARLRSEAQCRAALGQKLTPEQVRKVAAQAYVHRLWNLADLLLAERLLHPGTYRRYGGQVPEPHLSDMLAAQRRGQPAILVSAYYGPFDLLPIFLGYNGIHAAAVYLPHDNSAFDDYRRRIRSRSGCELVPVQRALERLPAVLEAGGTVAIVADHPAGQRGVPATFLGLPTRVPRSVGLLAWRYDADVVVAGIRRLRNEFQFEIDVQDVFKRPAWTHEPDPVTYITRRYLGALERVILTDPTQYLWSYARWGEPLAQELTEAYAKP